MKLYLSIILIFILTTKINAQELSFQYDAAGNQIKRQWICINCSQIIYSPTVEQVAELEKSPLNQEDDAANRNLNGFPNPVTEVLNVEWSSNQEIYVKQIELFSMAGVKVFEDKYALGQNSTTISFMDLAPGIYVLRATYSDEKRKTLKIIKK